MNGPNFSSGGTTMQLADAWVNVLDLCAGRSIKSIAAPYVSAGIFKGN